MVKRALVVGGSNGIGKALALHLASTGAADEVVIVGRSKDKTEAVAAEIGPVARWHLCDLRDQADIRRLAAELRAAYTHFDYVVLSAGLLDSQKQLTKDGVEFMLAINYHWRFYLMTLIIDIVAAAPDGARVLNVGGAGLNNEVFLDDPNFEREPWAVLKASGQAFQLDDVFTVEAQRRWGKLGPKGVAFHVVFPGQVATRTVSEILDMVFGLVGFMFVLIHPLKKTPAANAAELAPLLLEPIGAEGGKLWKCSMTRFGLGLQPANTAARVLDPEYGARCWALSESLVKKL